MADVLQVGEHAALVADAAVVEADVQPVEHLHRSGGAIARLLLVVRRVRDPERQRRVDPRRRDQAARLVRRILVVLGEEEGQLDVELLALLVDEVVHLVLGHGLEPWREVPERILGTGWQLHDRRCQHLGALAEAEDVVVRQIVARAIRVAVREAGDGDSLDPERVGERVTVVLDVFQAEANRRVTDPGERPPGPRGVSFADLALG